MELRRRIAFQQAKIILISSFLIGGLSALAQFYIDLTNVRAQQLENIERSLSIYEPSIKRAVYSLNVSEAIEVADLMVSDPLFNAATIFDDFGDLMAATHNTPKPLSWTASFSFYLLNIPPQYQRSLKISDGSKPSNAKLIVELDTISVAEGLANRALALGISGFFATVLLSAALFAIFYRFISTPIQRISQWVEQLERLGTNLSLPYQKEDELGDLVRNVHTIWHKKDTAAQQVLTLAYYDPLTQLANRRLLTEELDKSLETSNQHNGVGAVMYLDIDRFKTINDSLGHNVGDQLLVEIAERISKLVGRHSLCARFGGDEFVLLLPELGDEETAIRKAKHLAREIIDAVAIPTKIERNSIHCSTSIGITTFSEPTDCSNQVLRRADTALYRVKAEGRNNYQFYDQSMQQQARWRWEIEEGLHQAIAKDELQIWLQPQVSAEHNIIGAEVLLRWQHPEKGLISPIEFISIAEESGQIDALEAWVLDRSLALLRQWQNKGLPECFERLSINISPAHFMQPGFTSRVLALLDQHAIDGVNIEFEITENLLIENFSLASKTMNILQAHGISFAIDDFGTGYSSLRYLSQLPLNILKIDRSFISDLEHSNNDASLVEVILITADKLGLAVIAEGVETSAQEAILAEHGCKIYQGFYFSRPQPAAAFYSLLTAQNGFLKLVSTV